MKYLLSDLPLVKNIKNQKGIWQEDQVMNIDAEIAKIPPEYQRIDYAEIKYISLKQGKLLGLPLLEVSSSQGNLEYKLMHNNYEKLAHLDEETFRKYSDLLTKVLGERAKVKVVGL